MTQVETSRPVLAVASNNAGKIGELRALLGEGIQVVTLAQLGLESPEETGSSFEENAALKAQFVHQVTGLPALADDSGLEVDALDGAPGVHSARYAGEPSDDAANRRRLLEAMSEVPGSERGARFVAVIAVVDRQGRLSLSRGICEGAIATSERGTGGFGYDPLFELPDGRTMAELAPGEKNRISHRAAAMRLALPGLRSALDVPPIDGETGPP